MRDHSAGQKGMPIPILRTRKLTTGGTLRNGSVFVLGKMEAKQQVEDRIPILGEIPVLKNLFRHERTDTLIEIIAMRVVVQDHE
jgi:type II secretory pathway component GspD/PulD (secretin)